MKEEFGIKGKRYSIQDPLEDGNRIVRSIHPGAAPEGSTSHWSWSLDWSQINIAPVAEAWPKRGGGWWLRVKSQ